MLRTNSKAARQNIMNYIRDNAAEYIELEYSYTTDQLENDNNLCAVIMDIFKAEKYHGAEKYYHFNLFTAFTDWAQGLALGGLFKYYYKPAVDIVGDILDQTPAERARYTETDAENTMTRLIYRELTERAYKAQ